MLDTARITPTAGVRIDRGAAPDGTDALVFNGTAEGGVPFPVSDDELKRLPGTELSVSFWVRIDRIAESRIGLGCRIPQHRQPRQAPIIVDAGTVATAFGSYNIYSPVEQPLATGAWHHVAFTYSMSNLTFATYYDGIPQRCGTLTPDIPAPVAVSSLLGPLGGKPFTGAIGGVRLWNRALPAEALLRFRPSPAAARALAAPLTAAASDTPHAPFRQWCTALAAEAKAGEPVSLRRWQFIAGVTRDLPTLASWARLATGRLAPRPSSQPRSIPTIRKPAVPSAARRHPTDTLKPPSPGEYESLSFMLHSCGTSAARDQGSPPQ